MRHGNKINHLGRKTDHRKAMLSNMASSLLKNDKKRVITTLAKAKALRVFVEPLITKSKENSTHNRRIVFAYLRDKEAVTTLFSEISAAVAKRPGGYTRILKLGPRKGDNAEMALIELVDFNQFIKETKKKSRRRTAPKKAGKKEATKEVAAVEESKETTNEIVDEVTTSAEDVTSENNESSEEKA